MTLEQERNYTKDDSDCTEKEAKRCQCGLFLFSCLSTENYGYESEQDFEQPAAKNDSKNAKDNGSDGDAVWCCAFLLSVSGCAFGACGVECLAFNCGFQLFNDLFAFVLYIFKSVLSIALSIGFEKLCFAFNVINCSACQVLCLLCCFFYFVFKICHLFFLHRVVFLNCYLIYNNYSTVYVILNTTFGVNIAMQPEIQNYIFDLYGTLIDIRTDEASQLLWKRMATYYKAFGAQYMPDELMMKYQKLCKEEADKVAGQNGSRYPEAELGEVFRRLLTDKTTEMLPGDMYTWVKCTASMFRIISRKRFSAFPDSAPVLKVLRKKGKRVFLLTNAQAILTRPEIDEAGLTGLFDGIYISSEKGIAKPDPEFLLMLMKEHSLDPEETLIVGDNMGTDNRLADLCGMRSVYLNTAGYTEEQLDKQLLECSIHYPEKITRIMSGNLFELLRMT